MIKQINVSPINQTNELEFRCEDCGTKGVIYCFTEGGKKQLWNLDSKGDLELLKSLYNCPKCGKKL